MTTILHSPTTAYNIPGVNSIPCPHQKADPEPDPEPNPRMTFIILMCFFMVMAPLS